MLTKNDGGFCGEMEVTMEATRIWLTEAIMHLMERATETELDLIWRFARTLVA